MSDDNESAPGLVFGWPWSVRLTPAAGGAPLFGFAPSQLTQPINPGWSFGNLIVNSSNSSAPEVEQAVLSKQSYGRQIGRLMDVVAVLVAQLPKPAPGQDAQAIDAFEELVQQVDKAKQDAKAARLARLARELAALKEQDRAAWQALVRGP